MSYLDDGGLSVSPEQIKALADKYEVPVEQMMIAVAAIESTYDFWDSYYIGIDIKLMLGKVFGG